jgi:hypothetical protein
VEWEISPEPDAAERAAILAVLAEEAEEEARPPSPWAEALLPAREAPEAQEP